MNLKFYRKCTGISSFIEEGEKTFLVTNFGGQTFKGLQTSEKHIFEWRGSLSIATSAIRLSAKLTEVHARN